MTFKVLTDLPGIGKKMAVKLEKLGYPTVQSLATADPQKMYLEYMIQVGGPVDRCVLYAFRCAVTAAKNPAAVAGKNWWHFKD